MIGCYDFCGHYEWVFSWFEKKGGLPLVEDYWVKSIAMDSQVHATALIESEGFEGMMKYWGHTLAEESPEKGYEMMKGENVVRCDMHECPSKGFLIRNELEQYADYCDHCIGWIKPVMENAGFRIDHEHNHRGQCWWEFRLKEDARPSSLPGEVSGKKDVRYHPGWQQAKHDRFPDPAGE